MHDEAGDSRQVELTMVLDAHIAELQTLLGAGGLLMRPEEMAASQTGARHDRGLAAFVARPATTEQVSALLAYCCRHRIALVPQSGNTGLVAGSIPDMSGLQGVLSLDRLRSVFDLDLDNRSVRVGAGLRLSEINSRLEPHSLFFPIDLGADPRAGGMVATNTGGARFLRFGDVRRNTLGLKVVLADEQGTVLDLGDGLRKNNTGVDWKQCFIGTSGAFGVITECVFNLERLPRQTATAFLVPRSDGHVMGILAAMEDQLGAYLSAFEGMSKAAISCALEHVPSLRNPFPGGAIPDHVILVEISRSWAAREGEQSLDAVLEAVLGEIWSRSDEPMANAFVGRPQEMWALRHALSEGVKAAGHLVAFDLSFKRGDVMRFREHMRAELEAGMPAVRVCDFGHVGDGGLHFNLLVGPRDAGPPSAATVSELRDRVIRVAVEKFGGSFSAEHAIGRTNQPFYDRYTDEKLKAMASAFKQQTSPGPIGAARFG